MNMKCTVKMTTILRVLFSGTTSESRTRGKDKLTDSILPILWNLRVLTTEEWGP